MKLVLVNSPELITPGGPTGNSMITLAGKKAESMTVVPVFDTTMSVDNYPVVTKLTITVVYPIESPPYTSQDTIIINGTSVQTTINNQKMILQGDHETGKASGCTATVSVCGQTSTMVD